jgi:hypothetical protein
LDLKKHYELKKIVSNMLSIKDFVLWN